MDREVTKHIIVTKTGNAQEIFRMNLDLEPMSAQLVVKVLFHKIFPNSKFE